MVTGWDHKISNPQRGWAKWTFQFSNLIQTIQREKVIFTNVNLVGI